MEIADMKKGTTFLGFYENPKTGYRDVFEAIILDTEYVRDYENNIIRDILKVTAEVVFIKSDDESQIGKMELMFFTEDDLKQYPVAQTRFVSMENIYTILHNYNYTDNYDWVRIFQLNEEGNSVQTNSLLSEEEPSYSVIIFKLINGDVIQMIVLQETSCVAEYENSFVWINIVTDESKLLLPCDFKTYLESSFITYYENIKVEDINNNNKLLSFFSGAFAFNSQELNHFTGLGIVKDDRLKSVIFDTSSEEERINWGNGTLVCFVRV